MPSPKKQIFFTALAASLLYGCSPSPSDVPTKEVSAVQNVELHEIGQQLYQALSDGDGEALNALLHPDFRGTLTAGLPRQFGRSYDGRDAMIGEGWAEVGKVFQMTPKLERLYVEGDMIVGLGTYEGKAIETNRPVSARFAHFWTVKDGTIRSVEQVTDSHAWHVALEP